MMAIEYYKLLMLVLQEIVEHGFCVGIVVNKSTNISKRHILHCSAVNLKWVGLSKNQETRPRTNCHTGILEGTSLQSLRLGQRDKGEEGRHVQGVMCHQKMEFKFLVSGCLRSDDYTIEEVARNMRQWGCQDLERIRVWWVIKGIFKYLQIATPQQIPHEIVSLCWTVAMYQRMAEEYWSLIPDYIRKDSKFFHNSKRQGWQPRRDNTKGFGLTETIFIKESVKQTSYIWSG